MTFSPKVWGDVLRRLQSDISEFAFDAWIAPLEAKVSENGLVLGCPNSFHRDRVRLHHLESIERAWRGALGEDPLATGTAVPIELLTMPEFAESTGHQIGSRGGMKSVAVISEARAANAPDRTSPPLSLSPSSSAASTPMARRQGGSGTAGLLGDAGVDLTGSSASSVSSLRTGSSEPSARGSRGPLDVHGVPAPSENASRKGAAKVRNDHLSGHPAGPKPNARSAATSLGTSPGATPSATRARPTEPRAHAGQNFGLDGQPRGRQDEPFHFENFIVGPCNALAREATLALARRRQQSLSLLYLGGLSGMGKTHLAKAAANEARHQLPQAAMHARVAANARTAPRARVIYTTAEQFTSEFVSAMRNGRNDAWAKRYRGPIELLVVEDIQFLTGRDKTQLELFHTIGHVIDGGGSVLVTGDRTPRDLTGLDERLRTQVGSGFVAELDRPDTIVRRHILRAKAASGGVHLPSDCLDMLVHATDANGASVTEVESLLIQVVTTSSLLGRPVDAALVREAIDLKNGAAAELAPRQIDVTEIVKVVATFFGARPEALASRSRRRDVLVPRQLSMYLAHRYTDASLTEIGRCLGRDHPSVRNAIQRIERQVLENAPVRYQVEALSERIDGLL